MIRKARLQDVKHIHSLIAEQAHTGHLLPRALSEIYSQLRDFSVDANEATGEILGCAALHIVWEDLAELRSLAVQTTQQGGGIGTRLLGTLLREAEEMGVRRVFVLTYRPSLFERAGFKQMDKSRLPHKIWADCIKCTKFPDCDEIALVRNI